MKSKIIAAGLAGLLASTTVSADSLFGLYVKAGGWNQAPSGGVSDNGDVIDLESDLGMDSETGVVVSVAIEHFIPLIPNLKIEHTDLSYSSSSTLTREIEFDGIIYTVGEEINSELDLTHTDFVLYYEILDNWVSIDLGINIKVFDGNLAIDSESVDEAIDLSAPIPTLYGKVQFDVPSTDLSVGGEVSYLGYDGNTLSDIRGYIAYEIMLGFGVELGYRSIDLQFDDIDDVMIDSTFDGAYLSATFHL